MTWIIVGILIVAYTIWFIYLYLYIQKFKILWKRSDNVKRKLAHLKAISITQNYIEHNGMTLENIDEIDKAIEDAIFEGV